MQKNGLILVALLLTLGCGEVAASENSRQTVAVVADGVPVLELYRTDSGRLRYELNNDWLLGISLGVSPIQLTDSHTTVSKWAAHFDLFETLHAADRSPVDSLLESPRRIRWFWTIGSSSYLADGSFLVDRFDFRTDLVRHFSLQTKAGFVMPFGNHWLFGGALTVDRRIDSGSTESAVGVADETSAGAYFGMRFSY